MRKFMYTAASIAIVMAAPAVAQGKGHDNDHKAQQHGKSEAKKAKHGPDRKAVAKQAKRSEARRDNRQDRRQAARKPDKKQAKDQDRRQAARQKDRQAARKQAARPSDHREAVRKQAARQRDQRRQAALQQDRRQVQRQQARQQDRRQAQLQQNRHQAALQRDRQQQRIAQRTRQARQNIRQNVRDARRVVTARDRDIRSFRYVDYDGGRRVVHQRYVVNNDGRIRYRNWQNADYGVINGCPPGLARKGNGCLPPGQAKKLYQLQQARYYRNVAQGRQRAERRDYYDYLAYNPRYSQANYLYSDGYAYRLSSNRQVTAFAPLVGGALYQGNNWPQQYSQESVPSYYSSYYGSNSNSSYRYADDTLFGVNPQNQSITSIAGLLTGNDFAVGQRIPAGYDVYNVPYQYRSQYSDRANANYRYSDGYVYQVDPKTRLIQAAIQLLV